MSIVSVLDLFLNEHEKHCAKNVQCELCVNYKHIKKLDKNINTDILDNYCKSDKYLIDNNHFKKIGTTRERIHVIGNHWPLINRFKHRNFNFYFKKMSGSGMENVCITDITDITDTTDAKFIISQGYNINFTNYELSVLDFLLVSKKYIESSIKFIEHNITNVPFDWRIVSDKGFLVIDLKESKVFYTE